MQESKQLAHVLSPSNRPVVAYYRASTSITVALLAYFVHNAARICHEN